MSTISLMMGTREDVKVLLLNLKATTGSCIGKAFKLQGRWWLMHMGQVAFLQDIKKAIEESNPKLHVSL